MYPSKLSTILGQDNMNLIFYDELKNTMKVEAKIRYNHKAAPATISALSENILKVKFDTPQWAITPGQAVVFYLSSTDQLLQNSIDPISVNDYDIVFGGGAIVSKRD